MTRRPAAFLLATQAGEGGPAAHGSRVLHVQRAGDRGGELAAVPRAAGNRLGAELGAGWRWHDMRGGDGALRAEGLETQRAARAGVVWGGGEEIYTDVNSNSGQESSNLVLAIYTSFIIMSDITSPLTLFTME